MFAKIYRLERVQSLPLSLAACWEFFSNPLHLPRITPPSLDFDVTGTRFDRMLPGMILQYRVAPLAGIRLSWTTEITHIVEPVLFVDEQRFGPYKFWHHQHLFRETAAGVEMRDIVHYALPWGPLGRLVHALHVRRQLEEIFDYRQQVLREIFS